jgi:hypothetical protein
MIERKQLIGLLEISSLFFGSATIFLSFLLGMWLHFYARTIIVLFFIPWFRPPLEPFAKIYCARLLQWTKGLS